MDSGAITVKVPVNLENEVWIGKARPNSRVPARNPGVHSRPRGLWYRDLLLGSRRANGHVSVIVRIKDHGQAFCLRILNNDV